MTATDRARELLMSVLTPEQKARYLKRSGFTVVGEHTGLTYLLGYNFGPAVFTDRYTYCIHLADGYYYPYEFPTDDHILAQKIILETDELYFLNVARSSRRFTGFAGFDYRMGYDEPVQR